MSQSHISRLDTWRDHEERVIEAIITGLSLLRSEEGLLRLRNELELTDNRKLEDKISTVLYWYFVKATRQLWQKKRNRKKRGPVSFPKFQIPKPPDPNDRSSVSIERERKIPDFKWGFVDDTCYNTQEDQYKGDRDFDIECKRLGKPTSTSWKLNEQYVKNGIRRFITNEHRYGENESSGAMIGYIENMELDAIFGEINLVIITNLEPIPPLSKPSEGWQEHATSRLDHEFERPFPESPFHLWHFWVDLRGCYPRKKTLKENLSSSMQA